MIFTALGTAYRRLWTAEDALLKDHRRTFHHGTSTCLRRDIHIEIAKELSTWSKVVDHEGTEQESIDGSSVSTIQ
jgi:hypothetical protein